MLTLAFAQGAVASAPAPAQQSPLISLMPLALIFVIFYFLLIRPQKKQQKAQAAMIEGLEKNDDVVTSGGIHGTIVNLQGDVITLRVDDNTRIKIQKSAVSRLKKAKVVEEAKG